MNSTYTQTYKDLETAGKPWGGLGGLWEAKGDLGRHKQGWEGLGSLKNPKKQKPPKNKKNKGFRTYSAYSWVDPYARLFFLFFWFPRTGLWA